MQTRMPFSSLCQYWPLLAVWRCFFCLVQAWSTLTNTPPTLIASLNAKTATLEASMDAVMPCFLPCSACGRWNSETKKGLKTTLDFVRTTKSRRNAQGIDRDCMYCIVLYAYFVNLHSSFWNVASSNDNTKALAMSERPPKLPGLPGCSRYTGKQLDLGCASGARMRSTCSTLESHSLTASLNPGVFHAAGADSVYVPFFLAVRQTTQTTL